VWAGQGIGTVVISVIGNETDACENKRVCSYTKKTIQRTNNPLIMIKWRRFHIPNRENMDYSVLKI
jgi:hypothetical protein